jgi:hypothetical protein
MSPLSSHSGNSAEAHSWEEARKLDLTPGCDWKHVPQAQKWSVGRAVCQPAPESGDNERVPPVLKAPDEKLWGVGFSCGSAKLGSPTDKPTTSVVGS